MAINNDQTFKDLTLYNKLDINMQTREQKSTDATFAHKKHACTLTVDLTLSQSLQILTSQIPICPINETMGVLGRNLKQNR